MPNPKKSILIMSLEYSAMFCKKGKINAKPDNSIIDIKSPEKIIKKIPFFPIKEWKNDIFDKISLKNIFGVFKIIFNLNYSSLKIQLF